MPGAGISPAIMTDKQTPLLLDLSRSLSRVGRGLTGVDRVELAYLRKLVKTERPVFALLRTQLGYVLLDRTGMARFLAGFTSGVWGKVDGLARLTRQLPDRAGAESELRRICIARCLPRQLGRMLKRRLPDHINYVTVGHSHFSDRVIHAVRGVNGARISVLIHDTIPLDFPHFQKAGTVERFKQFLQRVGRWADLVICNSAATQADLNRHLGPSGPETIVAHLGLDLPEMIAPKTELRDRPYFMILGTIEPRKNHALLLDVWADLIADQDCPDLLICGTRGWNNDDVFGRLDQSPEHVHEMNGLPDAEVFGLMQNAAALLFPSHAEGYGLPALEAAALGVPVICNSLPVFHDLLGDIAVYADAGDRYLWATKIKQMMQSDRARGKDQPGCGTGFQAPTWEDHFNLVLSQV